MAVRGVSKCGAPAAEHTWFTGTVFAVPGVVDRAHGVVVDVVVDAVGAVVVDAAEEGADEAGAVPVTLRLTCGPHPAARPNTTTVPKAITVRRPGLGLRSKIMTAPGSQPPRVERTGP
jgi:hypothetical protein